MSTLTLTTVPALSFSGSEKYSRRKANLEEVENKIGCVGPILDAAKLVMRCLKSDFGGIEGHVPKITEETSLALNRFKYMDQYVSVHARNPSRHIR